MCFDLCYGLARKPISEHRIEMHTISFTAIASKPAGLRDDKSQPFF